ncbi:Adhesion G protein-coupled receptor L1 [Acropora cervicornis]|uniref:Adhesion G protein-coupled receptor L1 n=1 Tax=Acropora cervicornis TaxID=6130 RepID=A0AAD9PST3_ACRCE|nr:Adhesion G protein-coupled receptor L1 [Acropora cervicornis]
MDLRRDFLFPVIIWIVIQRDFILGGQAGFNNGSLILESGDVLEINTTVPSIVKKNCSSANCNFSASLEMRNSSNVAFVIFSGNIELKKGSTIYVTGKYALSITSRNGNITIQTDINMTCNREIFNTTCLGGYTQSNAIQNIYQEITLNILSGTCIPGSNHGGNMSNPERGKFQVGGPYDKENLTTFRGGSGGSCVGSPKGVAGGGTIELVSKTGSITIDASIRASAQSTSNDTRCSGGSGGLIRLNAQKVEILDMGRLIVDGGDGKKKYANGGAGGIIQIISPVCNLFGGGLSLGHGEDAPDSTDICSAGTTKANGYYYLQATPTISQSNSSVTSPTSSNLTGHDKEVEKLMALLKCLQLKCRERNKSVIREVISFHKDLTSSRVLSQQTVQPLCLESFKLYRASMDDTAERDPRFMKEALQGIFEIASDCIQEKNHPVWKGNGMLPELIQTLEDTLVTSLQGSASTEVNNTILSSNAVAQFVRENSTSLMKNITIPNFPVVERDSWKNVADSIVIPRSIVMEAKGNYTYVFVLFKDVANALPSNTTNKRGSVSSFDWEVSSLLMSCFLMLDDVPVKVLSPPARLTFNTSCSFWDNNTSSWSPEGIKLISPVNAELTVCETNHFTSFAVLIKHRDTELSHRDKLALSIITYVGCGVSTVVLAITLIVFLSIESLSADRHKIHMNLVLSLLLAQVLFLAGIRETSNQVVCKIIAVFMHYFYLTAFTWMLVEGLHLYLKVVQVFKTENVKILYYYIFGWGFAIIPVGITTALKPNNYGNSDICWLSLEDGTVNSIVLFMVIKTVVTSAASIKSSEYDHIKAGIKGLFVLMPILGVGWILGLFAVNKATVVFEYAFAIINGFQGLFIFLLHCVFNNEGEKNALSNENDSQHQATSSLIPLTPVARSTHFLPVLKKRSQPMSNRLDISDTSLKVNRTFESEHSNKMAITDEENEISSLHCPSLEDEERAPPKTSRLVNQRTPATRKQNWP